MRNKITTIFKQLILNVVIPTLAALLLFALINFRQTSSALRTSNSERNLLISRQMESVVNFQDIAFELIDKELTDRMREYSELLVNEYFADTKGVEEVDLFDIATEIGLNLRYEDIYIVSREGIVVNTTFGEDMGLDLFSFGEKHTEHLKMVFDSGEFVSELFTVEFKTLRLRKYTYQPTSDGEYIVEIGLYSSRADEIVEAIENVKSKIIERERGIIDVELFVMADRPFTLNKDAHVIPHHDSLLAETFYNKTPVELYEKKDGRYINYQYIYLPRDNTNLYEASVIRIISDRTSERNLVKRELARFSLILLITFVIVTILIYRKTRIITQPIKNLVERVDRITNGNLNERAEVSGNNEITRLSEKFNMMISQLESYYYELEEKVRERTIKIEKQKEEILAHRDKLAVINSELQGANIEIEEQKQHIMDSIYYARRIQTAILPSEEMIERLLPSSFILYLPKDIVSGDFYWLHEHDGHIMVAAVDCTGHGVPGAFMSIVGHNQLNHAVNVEGALQAGKILDGLNKGVMETLSDSVCRDSSIRDGMDLALCVFPPDRRRVWFAGANNPLVIIRDGELIKIKGDRAPIGATDGPDSKEFTTHDIDIIPGDMLYLFSDGYPDQFGGDRDKKFLVGRFMNLLLEIHKAELSEQQRILKETLDAWKGNREQVDDILVIGMRV